MRKFVILFFGLFCLANQLVAQIPLALDTANKVSNIIQIKYIHSDSLSGTMLEGAMYNRLLGNVSLEHNGTSLLCDSAYLYQEKNYVEAFGNVHIATASGAQITSDYLKYTGDNNMALLKKNVTIIDAGNQLQSDDVSYHTISKIAKYKNGGTLQSEGTQLISNEGIYNGISKDAYFKGDVVVTDPKYNINSKEMKYNTKTKFVTFLDESTIVSDSTVMEGNKGTYDANKEIGNFTTRSTVSNDEQQITANTMHYEKKTGISNARGNVVIQDFKNLRKLLANSTDYYEKTGYMKATGNVIIEDEKESRTLFANMAEYTKPIQYTKVTGNVIVYDVKDGRVLYADVAEYFKKNKYTKAVGNVWIYDSVQNSIISCNEFKINQVVNYSLATGNPIIRTLVDKDSLFMRADSFFSAPATMIDTIIKKTVPTSTLLDSLASEDDSTSVKSTLLGLGNIIIYSDSMQAVCDSVSYSQVDSIFKLYKKPLLWTRGNQAIGDTIHLQTVNNKLTELNLKSNASMISDTKIKDMYDQIYGDKIDGFIINDELVRMFADGSASCIYFAKNESNEYLGMNKTKSAQMRILLKERKVNRIIWYEEPEGAFIPMDKMKEGDKKEERFKWLDEKRPKNKEAVLGVIVKVLSVNEADESNLQNETKTVKKQKGKIRKRKK
jgi:lipopolysaccharide export system protein LptA